VRYGHLVDIGRRVVEAKVGRSATDAARRAALRRGLLARPLFGAALAAGRIARAFLPDRLARRIPEARPAGTWPEPRHSRKVIIAEGCVQPALAPNIDAATARVLDRIGISALRVPGGGCCGALSEHLAAHDEAVAFARRNVDAWWPHLDRDCEAVVVTASGCGVSVRDYGRLLAHDPDYAERAARVAALARDPVELVAGEWKSIAPLVAMDLGEQKVAFHSPCTLQHGLRIRGAVEDILQALGYTLTPVADAHLCCGSAGTYSILQPEWSRQLRTNKLAALEAGHPKLIATANIGCQTHLAAGTRRPVRHWIELLDERMLARRGA
jgi:glycolate oxidase iron-sulfur subunit